MTKIIPAWRVAAARCFTDVNKIKPWVEFCEDIPVMTAPLAIGERFSILAISQTSDLLESEVITNIDSIDPAISLANLYISIKDVGNPNAAEFIAKVKVDNRPLAAFTYSTQGNYRLMCLDFKADGLSFTLPVVDPKHGNEFLYDIYFATSIKGAINLELADTEVQAEDFTLLYIKDSAGNIVKPASNEFHYISNVLLCPKAVSIIGYDLNAFRGIVNRTIGYDLNALRGIVNRT